MAYIVTAEDCATMSEHQETFESAANQNPFDKIWLQSLDATCFISETI